MIVNDSNFSKKNEKKYCCKICDFYTCKKTDFERHLSTDKHQKNENGSKMVENGSDFSKKNELKFYTCNCGKQYKYDSGYYRHKKYCKIYGSESVTTELVLELIKDNKEMKQLLMEQSNTIQQQNSTINNLVNDVMKNGITNNSHNTTNSHNKAFNLNVFLNETCKEAINISDFVSSIKMSLEDLEHTGRKGYIEGISNIILRNLNDLEDHQRPIHCGDQKREILYIKDNNEWTKESEGRPILTKAIKTIANENIKQIQRWKDKHPDCTNADSKKNNLYLKIVSNSMNGLTEEESHKNINKIISNVAKNTIIDKHI